MTVFAVLSILQNAELGSRVRSTYGADCQTISPTIWFVADQNVTSAQVCEKLGIGPAGQFSNAIVIRFESYFGVASTAVWEWLKLKGALP